MPVKRKRKSVLSKRKKRRLRYYLLLLLLLVLGLTAAFQYRYIERVAVYWYFKLFVEDKALTSRQKTFSGFEIKLPLKYHLHGIDVARYQRTIDWQKVTAMQVGKDSITFVFIKATEGKTLIDQYFEYNWKNAKKHGLLRGAYHYYKPQVNSKKQARNFISVVDLEKGDMPPVLDIEETGPYGKQNMLSGIKNWLELIEKQYGVKPVIYTYYKFYEEYLEKNKDFKDYPVWIAHYYRDKLPSHLKWTFWQHSDLGKVNGISGPVDFNVFYGNMEQLKEICY